MKLNYFPDTDTLYIELQDAPVAEIKNIDGNTLVEVDAAGNPLAVTIEHANESVDLTELAVKHFSAVK